jgi:hypothetical protein
MSYPIPDNFKGSTGYNVNSFAIPGLMPTTTPVYDSQVVANADGSIVFEMFSVDQGLSFTYPFPVALTTIDNKVLLMDTEGEHVLEEIREDGRRYYIFVIDGTEKALPVGQTILDVKANSASKRWVIVNNDSPFNLGIGSNYRRPDINRPLRYVVRNYHVIPAGTTQTFVPFQPNFFNAPQSVHARLIDENEQSVAGVVVSNITADGFTITLNNPTAQEYTLDYIAWSYTTPLIISGLAVEAEEFRIDPDVLLIG